MRSLEELSQVGTQLGYEGSDLRDFVKEQQALERDERAAAREAEKLAAEQKRLDNEAEQKRLDNEAEQKRLDNEGRKG